jgi:alpha-tubulin suppressor-like RCC1 family protein
MYVLHLKKSRGQLGHGDLEDCDEPKLVEAIAGLKVVQISAGGWHNAVITNQVRKNIFF